MKRKVAILLAAVMTTAMLPMNVMAESSNSVNKVVTVSDGDVIEGVYLKIMPKDEITSDDSIIININNGTFDEEEIAKKLNKSFEAATAYKVAGSGEDFDTVFAVYASSTLDNALTNYVGGKNVSELPYKITVNNKKQIQVQLFPITGNYCDNTNTTSVTGPNKAYYNIPIVALAEGTGNVTVTVDSNEAAVTGGGEFKVAVSSNKSGSTTTTISEVKTFTDSVTLDDITISENVKGTFEKGKVVKMRLSSGFIISSDSKISVKPGSNASFGKVDVAFSDDEITFAMPIGKEGKNDLGTAKPSAITVSGIKIEADDEDKNWGDVSFTISGAEITKETIKVATRADYGFKMSVLDEVTTIMSGRTYVENNEANVDTNEDLDSDDFKTATIKFEETTPDSWNNRQALNFTVPEGVKIIDAEFDEEEVIDGSDLDAASIYNDGQTLRIPKGTLADRKNVTDNVEFEMNLYLSIDADFAGEVPVSVYGAGLAEGTIDDVVVANAVAPIALSSTSTKANMGYQAMSTGDIVITEAQAGALLDDGEVIVSIDCPYGSNQLGFADDKDLKISVEGELQTKNFKLYNDLDLGSSIKFVVDKTSYNEPSTITISGVKVGTTRSIPYGTYDFKVSGDAVVNNYTENVTDVYPVQLANVEAGDAAKNVAFFETTDSYSFADYLVVVTETGTLDGVVEVTIGEKTITMDGESLDMDVAAYIQASSNSTMVPVRFVALAIGVDKNAATDADNTNKIMWDATTKTATILYAAGSGQKIIQFTAGSPIMKVDGTGIVMENGVVAEITDGRMFVPFRALGQALGVSVSWDAETRTAIYNAK